MLASARSRFLRGEERGRQLLHTAAGSPSISLRTRLTYPQTERATAYGWFMSGTLIGPALGTYYLTTEITSF